MASKKFNSIILASLIFSLVGCGNKVTSSSSKKESSSESISSSLVSSSSNQTSSSTSTSESLKEKYNCISLEEAIRLAGEDQNYQTPDKYYVYGVISEIKNTTYGNLTIQDGDYKLSIYGCYDSNGVRYDALEDKPYVGDEVVFYGNLTYYNMAEIKDATIVEFKHKVVEEDKDYTKMNVKGVRDAADNTNVITSGVVSQITYANGFVPNGFFLVDETSSIYVYGSDVATMVKVGNKVEVQGTKVYYISEDEATNAAKYEYKGANQITNAQIISNDKGTNEFSTSSIEELSVKDIMDKKPSEDFFTQIYKVNAQIVKKENPGFVNYYINDFDGKTGSYVYTACNGADFSWLDSYDGKLCTLYLSPINAKSTASGCIYRFVPISVVSDNYEFDTSKTSEFAVNYYGLSQFFTEYSSNPNLELLTSVDIPLLGLEGIQLSYSSSNTNVFRIDEIAEKPYLVGVSNGTSEISVTAVYDNISYTGKIEITLTLPEENIEYINVSEAINAKIDSLVTVRGIAGPSLVNQVGFYLIDESGAIAIKTNKETMDKISLGNDVILQGKRVNYNPVNCNGQTCLLDCELVVNYYGNTDYSTKSFNNQETISSLSQMSVKENHTSQVYYVQGEIIKEESAYYSLYKIKDADGTTINLYSSSSSQYSWLSGYENKEIFMEVALCNWNKKNYHQSCLLAIEVDGTKLVNKLNYSA